jgi:dynein heavy chain
VGIPDNPEARTNFFVSKVKKNLHVVLAFSPVGDTFRVRARRNPGLVNNTAIDQFHPSRCGHEWIVRYSANLAMHMAEEHLSVANVNIFLQIYVWK